MVAVPAVTPETRPEVALTVAMVGSLLDHEPPDPVDAKVDVWLTQMFWLPLKVPVEGVAVTVTVRVAVAFAQPPVPVTVYVMVALPAATPVTRPVVGLTVAMVGALLDHEPPVTVDAKVDVPFTQIP
jgi:hypothetical protein